MSYYREALGLYIRFLGFLRPYWRAGTAAGVLMILSALLQLPMPLLTRYLIDDVLPQADLGLVNRFLLVLLGVLAVSQVVAYTQGRLLILLKTRVDRDLRAALFRKILVTQAPILERSKTGYLQSRIDADVGVSGNLFMETLLQIVINVLTFVVGLGLIYHLHPTLATLTLVSLPLLILSSHHFSTKINRLSRITQERWAAARGVQMERIRLIRTIKAVNQGPWARQSFEGELDRAAASSLSLGRCGVTASIAVSATAAALPILVLWLGVRSIMQGSFTLGGLVAFTACVGYLISPVQSLAGLNISIQTALAAARRIFEVLDHAEEDERFGKAASGRGDRPALTAISSLRFEGVSYAYDGTSGRGLRDLSFSIEAGSSLAIVGETGSGKSTVTRLLLGLDVPSSGRILINNRDYTELGLGEIRSNIGYVPQEPDLVSGTISDNIGFFDPDQDPRWISQLVRWCVLEETIERFSAGLETQVLEAGDGISGGERQRIAIARALYRRPSLLVLDEATSALDAATEARLIPSLLTLPWSPAVLLITHSPALIDLVDSRVEIERSVLPPGCLSAPPRPRAPRQVC